jgi:nucleotide-binding universal stress UspA family protein
MLERILAPLDGSSLAECTLPHVVALARVFEAEITLLQVVEQPACDERTDTIDPLAWQMRRAEAEGYIHKVANDIANLGIDVKAIVIEGRPAKAIVDFAHHHFVDLIALSSHGQSGLSEWGISSVAQKVLLRADASVYIVRAHDAQVDALDSLTYRKLLVPLDGSQRAECAVGVATVLAQAFDADLLLAHVINRLEVPRRNPLSAREQDLIEQVMALDVAKAERYMTDIKAHSSERAETMVRVGNSPIAELHRIANERQVDLIVLSAHGCSGEPRWAYGSICLNLLFYGKSSLLILQDVVTNGHEPSYAELGARERQGH